MTRPIRTEHRTCGLRRTAAASLFVVFLFAGDAMAQAVPDRGGFTVLVDAGVGVQRDSGIDESATGLAGLNLGIGAFLTHDVALMLRITGTNVNYDFGAIGHHFVVKGPVSRKQSAHFQGTRLKSRR